MLRTRFEPGLLGLHDHVEQDDGGVVVVSQQSQRFLAGIGADQLQRAFGETKIAEHETGDVVHFGLIVNDEHFPRR
jgi:hypothetical protein